VCFKYVFNDGFGQPETRLAIGLPVRRRQRQGEQSVDNFLREKILNDFNVEPQKS
jgi:hypothetical protein